MRGRWCGAAARAASSLTDEAPRRTAAVRLDLLRISRDAPDSFSEALGRTDALYYTVTVFATVGFGDIAPRSELARILTMIQMLTGLVVVGLVAKILLDAVQTAVRRRESEGPATAVAPDVRKRDATDRGIGRGGG